MINQSSDSPRNSGTTFALITRCSLAAAAMVSLLYSGCAICCGPHDYDYPTFGGAVQRADPVRGRVGSVFSDPGPFGGPSADYNLIAPDSNSLPVAEPIESSSNGLEPLDNDLEPLEPEGPSQGSGARGSSSEGSGSSNEVLPPPSKEFTRPSPDDTTSYRQYRNQSSRTRSRWR